MPRQRKGKSRPPRGEGRGKVRKYASARTGYGSSRFDSSTGHKRGGTRAVNRNRRRAVDARYNV